MNKFRDDLEHVRNQLKEQKREKRTVEMESIKNKTKVEQLELVLKTLHGAIK